MVGFVVRFDIDPFFHKKLVSGQKTVSFSPDLKNIADYDDVFFINMQGYQIIRVEKDKNLYDYVALYWHDAGFDKPNDAVEWLKEHHFNGDVPEQYGEAFKAVKGTIYTFKKLTLDNLKCKIDHCDNLYSRYLWHLQFYLHVLSYMDPKEAGYDESYLKRCEETLKEADDNLFFDFMAELFPSNDEEED